MNQSQAIIEALGEKKSNKLMPSKVGDVVKYERGFLKSTGQITGAAPFAVGKITKMGKSISPKNTDPSAQLVHVDWGKNKGELPEKTLLGNLILKNKVHLEPN